MFVRNAPLEKCKVKQISHRLTLSLPHFSTIGTCRQPSPNLKFFSRNFLCFFANARFIRWQEIPCFIPESLHLPSVFSINCLWNNIYYGKKNLQHIKWKISPILTSLVCSSITKVTPLSRWYKHVSDMRNCHEWFLIFILAKITMALQYVWNYDVVSDKNIAL